MIRILAITALIALPSLAAAEEYENCYASAKTSFIPPPLDETEGPAACAAACEANEACVAWSIRMSSLGGRNTGSCRLFPDLSGIDPRAADSGFFCGEVKR